MGKGLWILNRIRAHLNRGWKRLRYGKPTTEIALPFEPVQAAGVLNAVLSRGTFTEINTVFATLGALGYTAVPMQESHTWQLVPIPHLSEYPISIPGQAPTMARMVSNELY